MLQQYIALYWTASIAHDSNDSIRRLIQHKDNHIINDDHVVASFMLFHHLQASMAITNISSFLSTLPNCDCDGSEGASAMQR